MSIIQRTYYRIENVQGLKDRSRMRVPCGEADADLVSSLCVDGTHAPVLDIDMPATLRHLTNSASALTVHGEGDSYKVMTFLEFCYWYKLLDESTRDAFYASPWRMMKKMPYPEMQIAVPATLLPSHTEGHFHLMLDASLDWPSYENMLERAQACGLIAMEYLILCRRHEKGFLWMPGKKQAFYRQQERTEVGPEARCREIAATFPGWDPYCGSWG